MTVREPLNLEQLLDRLGSNETPGDTNHRYALRRALLKSRSFEVNQLTAKWLRLFSLTTSAVAGGAVAVAFVMVIQTTLNMEVQNNVYAIESSQGDYTAYGAVTTSDMMPMDFLNQMRMVDFEEIVPEHRIRQIFDQNVDLAFTR